MSAWLDDGDVQLYLGDALKVLEQLPSGVAQTVVTSPPYWGLRDYGSDGQLGLEATPAEYVDRIVNVFRAVRHTLRDDGTVWLNLGDSHAGSWGAQSRPNGSDIKSTLEGGSMLSARQIEAHPRGTHTGSLKNTPGLKPKDLVGIPWRVAFALQADGWYLRSAITWCKGNAMPESVTDRPTKATEIVFLLSKQPRYFFDQDAVREESGANLRDFWVINPQPFSARALDDGTLRKVSADCPVHGDRPAPVATARHGEHAADPSAHNGHTDGGHAQVPLADSVPTEPILAPATAAGSSGSPSPSSAPAATGHSNGTRRTGLDPATSPAYTASARTPACTGDTSASPALDALFDHTHESSISRDGSDAHLSARTEPRSEGKCSCPTIDHFATYPEALVRRCILAGTSEHGECSACGAPWVRQVERESANPWQERKANGAGAGSKERGYNENHGAGMSHTLGSSSRTTGWAPSCSCGAPARPQTVLDPFVGSGTTALVARKHGRRAVGIDLSEPYLEIAARRLGQQSLFAPVVVSREAQ